MTTTSPVLNPTYRTHTCGELRANNVGETVKLSGWVDRRRDHGGVVFIDLRDTYGKTQIVFDPEREGVSAEMIEEITHTPLESVITVEGEVLARGADLVNEKLDTGAIEVSVTALKVVSKVEKLPYSLHDENTPEELRLQYRFMDLRTDKMQHAVKLRGDVFSNMRERMASHGFREFQTPILTASSPEGARDFLVPSRLHPGKFYALPQAPQQFKQLLMVSGFDRYFQIAPCFRDEDARADRSPTEFYQLDLEMSFVEQDDVFNLVEDVVGGMFKQFANHDGTPRTVDKAPWVRIPFADAMLKYGTDKPDLRIPLEIMDVSDVWAASDFGVFKGIVADGGHVRALPAPKCGEKPRSWFDTIAKYAQNELGAPAAPGHIIWSAEGEFKGPLVKFLKPEQIEKMFKDADLTKGDGLFFVAAKGDFLYKLAGPLRVKLGEELGCKEIRTFRFCWITDFPLYEKDESTGKIDFSHNPFSMPHGGREALENKDPLDITGQQYDAVCNGYEILSGAIRNADPETMVKAFEIAGYTREQVETEFKGMISAFKHGAPPHGGCALGMERLVMLLTENHNIRAVTAFPMTQQGIDLMMGAPSEVSPAQLKDLCLMHVNLPQKDKVA
jgi:aspartyl-tRNA synthetase